jgi:hypothetical protein
MDAKDSYIDFMEASLLVLNKDELIKIMENLDSKTIGRLCSVSKKFERICSDPSFWKRLIRSQFPNEDIENDPRAQYIELTDSRVTTYFLLGAESSRQEILRDHTGDAVAVTFLPKVSLESYDEIWQTRESDYLEQNYPEEVGDFSFPVKIKGPPKRDGTKIWLLVFEGSYQVAVDAYKTKRDAILEATDYILREAVSQEDFPDSFEIAYGITPTRENIMNYLEKYSFLHFRPLIQSRDSDDMFSIMEIELYHESPYFKDVPRIE